MKTKKNQPDFPKPLNKKTIENIHTNRKNEKLISDKKEKKGTNFISETFRSEQHISLFSIHNFEF